MCVIDELVSFLDILQDFPLFKMPTVLRSRIYLSNYYILK